ncbi:helix-turn-helix transcriptional regulator [Nocardia sp. NPDC050630]|uniref:helix-turn-helix transcriptional regulator n=1 Tax=Nocardia sp. NPDC050630 TaxID=3364321 RepID=UPI003795F242
MDTRGEKNAAEETSADAVSSSGDADGSRQVLLSPDELKEYGQVLRQRREHLGLTVVEAARLGQVSRQTIHDIEAGKKAPGRGDTCRRLDKAYRYVGGSVLNLYNFKQLPVNADDPVPAAPPRVPTTDFRAELPLKALIELVEADQRLEKMAQSSDDPELRELRQAIGRSTDRLLRAFVVSQVEGRRAAGHDDGEFIATLLAVQVRPPIADDEQDRDESAYLRWLLGRPENIPPEDQARYAEQFASRTQGR